MDRSTARKAALIATAVVAAGVVAYATTMRSTPPLGKQAFYYDLSAQKLFTDAAGQYPPIRGKHDAVGGDPEGQDGVLAIVYRCCDRCTIEKIQIAYLQKYTDKAKAIFEQADQAEADTRVKGVFNHGMGMIGTLLADPNGPRIGSIDLNGWDTHTEERPTGSSLGKTLARLDEGLGTLRQGLGKAWDQTVVSVITEFGRTVRVNGSRGTDHGTATVAILVGGAVKGGRVIADWPGLGQGALYADRDLKPTADLRAMLKGVLREHLGLEGSVLARSIFPDSDAVKPMDGLIV